MNHLQQLQTEIIGHDDARAHLEAMLNSDCLPHALVLSGPSGVGKYTVARALAAAILGRKGAENTTQLVLAGTHPDLHLIELDKDKKDISVDAVREMMGRLSLKPYLGCSSVGIIDTAQRMSTSASNAMLMTLEEPSPGTYLILVSEAAHRLPATVLSRCRTVGFASLVGSEVESVLLRLCPDLDKKLLAEAVKLARGSLTGLQLAPLLDPKTRKVEDPTAFAEHLAALSSEAADLRKRLVKFLGSQSRVEGEALSLASVLLRAGSLEESVWQELISQARGLVRGSEAKPEKAAEWLLQILTGRQLIEERNLNAELQLANILLNAPTKAPKASTRRDESSTM